MSWVPKDVFACSASICIQIEVQNPKTLRMLIAHIFTFKLQNIQPSLVWLAEVCRRHGIPKWPRREMMKTAGLQASRKSSQALTKSADPGARGSTQSASLLKFNKSTGWLNDRVSTNIITKVPAKLKDDFKQMIGYTERNRSSRKLLHDVNLVFKCRLIPSFSVDLWCTPRSRLNRPVVNSKVYPLSL